MKLVRTPPLVGFIACGLLLCITEALIVASPAWNRNATVLALIITADLVLGIPALYYLLLVRRRHAPPLTLVPVFVVSVILAGRILPAAHQTYLRAIEQLLPLIELALLVFVGIKARTIARHYRAIRPQSIYPTDAVEASLRRTFGPTPIVPLLITELSLLYYALFGWFKRWRTDNPQVQPFSYHRKVGYGGVLGMFALAMVGETVGIHLVVQHWNPTIAWVLTGLSLYTFLWLVGDFQTARLQPIVLTETHLHLRCGLRWQAVIPLTEVDSVSKAPAKVQPTPEYLKATLLGEPQWILELNQAVQVRGLFGITKTVWRIGVTIDDAPRFRAELSLRLAT